MNANDPPTHPLAIILGHIFEEEIENVYAEHFKLHAVHHHPMLKANQPMLDAMWRYTKNNLRDAPDVCTMVEVSFKVIRSQN